MTTHIESKGNGGYVLAPRSPPCCHPNGKPYEQAAGPSLPDIPRISPDERDDLLDAARSLIGLATANGTLGL